MKKILNLDNPIIGLAPMDGVSDSPFRFITKRYGNPDIMFTEFTNVMGMCIAGDKIMHTFHYDESQRPIIGQIYGSDPQYFYHAAKIICTLGFDGVDINMGCPAKNVASSGAGAGLIRTPDLAREIIAAVKKGVSDWVENGELTGLSERSKRGVEDLLLVKKEELVSKNEELRANNEELRMNNEGSFGLNNLISSIDPEINNRNLVPVSVKTRIGFDQPVTESWIKNISLENPEWITVHGRTLKQMYTGKADWNEIKRAVESTDIPVLANGDINSKADLENVLELTKASGVLIGRATFGNPWVLNDMQDFKQKVSTVESISLEQKVKVMLEHTEKFVELYKEPKLFFQMRKHFGWYMKGFDGAVELRKKLMTASSIDDVKAILTSR